MSGRPPSESCASDPACPPSRLIVTIDGPAGTGKSSVARALARRLGLDFLDTGAMYRAAAAIALDENLIDETGRADPQRLVDAVVRADLRFDWGTDPPTLLAFGRSIMRRLREPDVTAVVSPISAIAPLRRYMVQQQRQIGAAHPRLVTEGRDQGSVVFEDADVKFYLDASPRVRAQRRADQLRALGQPADLESLEREIEARDRSDAGRSEGPLVCPPGAHRIDTSDLAFEQVVDALERTVRNHLAVRTVRPRCADPA
jgi:cytidylate kinase